MKILARACAEAAKSGYMVSNIDSVIIAEAPRMGPHLAAMKENLAGVMGIPSSAIGIKATTHEKLGDLGKGLGIAAQSVCLLSRRGTVSDSTS